MKFDQAKESVNQYYRLYSDETSKYLLKAYYLRWKHSPITESKEGIYQHYLQVLDSAENMAAQRLKKDPDNLAEAYYYMTAHIMRAELFALNGDMVKAAFEGKGTFSYIKKGFEWCKQNPEFYTTTGLYNFYVELYREKGFFYQTLLWPFSKGSKIKGLKYLEKASEKAVFTKVEATIFLSHLNFKMEIKPEKGLQYLKELRQRYPNNLKFIEMHIENLLALKQFDEAEKLLPLLQKKDDPYVSAKNQLFGGILTSEIDGDYLKADVQLKEAINQFDTLEGDQDHYQSLAYFYLAKMEMARANFDKRDKHLDKAASYVKYPYLEQAIKRLRSGI